MSIMISSDTKMKYLGIQKENLMKVRRTVLVMWSLYCSCSSSTYAGLSEVYRGAGKTQPILHSQGAL